MPEMDLVTLIAQVGFPIAVCVYLLWERTTTIKALIDVVSNNTKVLTRVCTVLNVDEGDGR